MNPLRFTLWGINEYIEGGMFENILLPEGLDKDILIDTIMQKSGMLYPYHQQPQYLKKNIQNWFARKEPSFTRMLAALSAEYNPIENYDRNEEWTDTPNITRTRTGGYKDTVDTTDNVSNENKVSAFNISTYQPDSENSGSNHTVGETERVYNNEAEKEVGETSHRGHIHGNIGVTTNQQMIEAELKLREFDIYEYIAEKFEDTFLVQVY